jgi:hypothetical protein
MGMEVVELKRVGVTKKTPVVWGDTSFYNRMRYFLLRTVFRDDQDVSIRVLLRNL